MKGIAVAGTVLLDKINEISKYPNSGELTKINGVSKAVGGLVPNVGVDLKIMDKDLPVYAVGLIGNDGDGKFIKDTLKGYGLNVDFLVETEKAYTSFSDVMSITGGQRTFFTYAGACAEFGVDEIDFENLKVDMLHLGYFLLLDKIDNGDGIKILEKAKKYGLKTSIDLVSENSDRYKQVLPCLKYVDNLIINEVEAGKMLGIDPSADKIKDICYALKDQGVIDRVIIHMPNKGVCLSKDGYTEVNSLELPNGYIKGSTGAGDAFCAGALLGIYKGWSDKEILSFASCSAAASLSKPDAVSGMMEEKEVKNLEKIYKRKSL